MNKPNEKATTTYVATAFAVFEDGYTGDACAEGAGGSYSDALCSLARDIDDNENRDPSFLNVPHKHIEVCVEKQK